MPLYWPSLSQCLAAWCSFAVTRRTHTIGIQRNAVQIMIACQQTASWRAIVEDVSLPLGSSESRSHAVSGFDRLRITRFTYVFASSLTPLRVYLQFPCACFCHLRAEGLRAGYIFQFIRASGPGPFRPIVAVQQYVRSWRKSRHGADIANRSSLTRS
jgi:hypothetical protein